MDEIKRISSLEFNSINSKHPFQKNLLAKDYFVTLLLYLIKDVGGYGATQHLEFLNKPSATEVLIRTDKSIEVIAYRGKLTDRLRNVPMQRTIRA